MEGHVHATLDGNLLADEPLGRCRVVLEDIRNVLRFPPSLPNGVAGIGNLDLGELLVVLGDDAGKTPENLCSRGWGRGRPALLCNDGLGDGVVSRLDVDELDAANELLGRGVDDVERSHGRSLEVWGVALTRAWKSLRS